ncbi:MAG: VCBS repeat-containing protein [Actinomycetota bacterium]|nr:VCBS repeat-containing protein [Actinomycetota bacterium]
MTRTDRCRALAALAAFLTAGLSLLLAGTGASGLDCGASWKSVSSPERLDKPRGVAAIGRHNVWVVGSKKTSVGPVRTGAAHWNGNKWSLKATPNVGDGDNALLGVDARASKDIWAVGYFERGGRYGTLIERWNGGRWRLVKSPNAASGYNTLTDVDALSASSAWAVGSYRTDYSRKTLIERWDGSSWKIVSSPNPANLSNSLLGVAAIGPDNVWAVGWKSDPNGLRSLVLHRGAAGWREVAVPTFGTGDNVLTGISPHRANDIWATGYYVDGRQYRTLTLHYNGGAWSRVPSANGGDGTSILKGIGAFSSTNAWAVGFTYRADLHHYVASTQHWDGSKWSGVASDISRHSSKDSEMFSVAKAPLASRVWAVGRPSDVEIICHSRKLSASATSLATDDPGISSTSLEPAPQRADSSSEEPQTAATSVLAASSGTPVRAVNKAADAGIAEKTTTHGAVIFDYNNDRRSDIFLGRHGKVPRLYKNTGSGHFKEIDKGDFSGADRHGCDAANVNSDGLEDIFCTIGAKHSTAAKRDELYIQRPDHTFAERAGNYGVFDPFGRGRLAKFIHANGDARPDLFVVNEANRGDAMPSPNRLFIYWGRGKYHYAPGYGLEREMDFRILEASAVRVGDLDRDGWQDLVLPSASGLRVYHNDQGKAFTDVAASVGLGQNPSGTALADVNGDRWTDVIEVSSGRLSIMINHQGTFSRGFSTSLRYGTDVAAGDVNADNRPDIYLMRGKSAAGENPPDWVYINNGSGTSFRRKDIPSTREGNAESVWTIDYDRNGLADFLALNGAVTSKAGEGPVQLIAFFRAS